MLERPRGRLTRVGDFALACAASLGYALGLVQLVAFVGRGIPFGFAFCGVALVGGVTAAYRTIQRRGRAPVYAAIEVLVLVVLAGWGLALDATANGSCIADACGADTFRPLALPEALLLVPAHALTVLAYALSRRRPERLRPVPELVIHAALAAGILFHVVLAIQFSPTFPLALLFVPIMLPAWMPFFTIALYGRELITRARRRASETDVLRPPWGSVLARALGLAPFLLGLYGIVLAAIRRDPMAAAAAFTRTCSYPFSTVAVVPPSGDCHYLCTVAAQGHTWLVRPERLGVRRGRVIVVNRQLAVANAFEDVLHERWPRVGGALRRAYDALGLPVSRMIRSRVTADLIYIAMKPAEWCFYAALLFADPGDPEKRVGRMYAPPDLASIPPPAAKGNATATSA